MGGKALMLVERIKIWELFEKDYSLRKIARIVGRAPSTICDERKRGNKTPKVCELQTYDKARYLQDKYLDRLRGKKRGKGKVLKQVEIRQYVIDKIQKCRWSPWEVSARIKMDKNVNVSAQSIYTWIKTNKRELIEYLKFQGKPRRQRVVRKRNCFQKAAPEKRSITERPAEINNRETYGNFEADLIIGSSSKECILSVGERKSRHCWFYKIPNKKAETVIAALFNIFNTIPKTLHNSITFDRGGEFADAYILERTLKLTNFFCQAYSAWQKGFIENINGEFRHFFPSGTDFSKVSNPEIAHVQNLLNNRPLACLNRMFPSEVFDNAAALNSS